MESISASAISTSASGTLQSGIVEELGMRLDLSGRPLVFSDRPDVEPDSRPGVRHDLAPLGEHRLDYVGEVEAALRNQLEDLRVIDIDAHADVEPHGRLLDVLLDEPIVGLDHAEVDVDLLAVRRDRQPTLVPAVKAHQLRVVERGQDVTVHRQEWLIEALDLSQRTGGSKRRVLPPVPELQAGGELDVVEVGLDQATQM